MKRFSSTTRVSSRRTSPKKRVTRTLAIGGVLIAALMVAPSLFGTVTSVVLTPVMHFETLLAKSGNLVPQFFVDRNTLIRTNHELERTIANTNGTQQTIARLQNENTELRSLLGVAPEERIAAGVIGRPTVTPYDVIVIDKGFRDGVEQDAPVYIGIDQAIGYVAAVFPDSSVVTLLSTPHFESSVYIIGPNIYTTARGLGGGVLEVSVPQGIPLSVGDLVIVPALGAGVYGTVDVIDSIPTEPEQRGYVTFTTPIQSMRFVTVGTSALTPLSFSEAVTVVANAKENLATVPVPSGILVDTLAATSTATSTDEETITEP